MLRTTITLEELTEGVNTLSVAVADGSGQRIEQTVTFIASPEPDPADKKIKLPSGPQWKPEEIAPVVLGIIQPAAWLSHAGPRRPLTAARSGGTGSDNDPTAAPPATDSGGDTPDAAGSSPTRRAPKKSTSPHWLPVKKDRATIIKKAATLQRKKLDTTTKNVRELRNAVKRGALRPTFTPPAPAPARRRPRVPVKPPITGKPNFANRTPSEVALVDTDGGQKQVDALANLKKVAQDAIRSIRPDPPKHEDDKE